MAVIPQEPFIIEGSLRENIDLRNDFSDSEIVEVLKRTGVWNSNLFSINTKKNGSVTMDSELIINKKLNFEITDNGDNLSIG